MRKGDLTAINAAIRVNIARRVNGNGPDFGIGFGKFGSLNTERRKLIRSAAGETFWKKCQQQIFLAAQIGKTPHGAVHIANRKIGRRFADF